MILGGSECFRTEMTAKGMSADGIFPPFFSFVFCIARNGALFRALVACLPYKVVDKLLLKPTGAHLIGKFPAAQAE